MVRTPAVAKRSFTATGIPWSGPRYSPCAISVSARRASDRAASAVTVMKALRIGSSVVIRASAASANVTGDTRRERTSSAASSIVNWVISSITRAS